MEAYVRSITVQIRPDWEGKGNIVNVEGRYLSERDAKELVKLLRQIGCDTRPPIICAAEGNIGC